VGYYGGINYGYGRVGYEGGRWEGENFSYNTYVNQVNTTILHNIYNTRVTNVSENHVSYSVRADCGMLELRESGLGARESGWMLPKWPACYGRAAPYAGLPKLEASPAALSIKPSRITVKSAQQ
jgi:hypothetical protein